MSTESTESAKGKALRASALMAFASTASRLLGFVRTFLIGMVFGGSASIAANAYSAANVLPSSVWILVGGGTLNAILVPAIVRAMRLPDKGNDYMSRLFTLVLLVSGVLALVCTLMVPLLLVIANSALDPATMQAATILGYFLMPQIVFSAIYIMFGQILNAHESFGPYQWAPALNNVFAIIGSVIFLILWGSQPDATHWTWPMILVLVLGILAGSAAQAGLVWAWTRKYGLRIRLKWGFRGLGLGKLGRLGLWTLAMVGLGQIALFARRWSTGEAVTMVEQLQKAGREAERGLYPALASLDWSYVVFMMPQGIIAVALVTSIFPRMSKQATSSDHTGAYHTYSAMNRILFVPMILTTVLISVLAAPIMWVAIGGTSRTAAEGNGLVLAGFMLGLVPFSAVYLMKRFYYAYEEARLSFVVQIPVTLVTVAAVIPILQYVDPRYAAASASVATSIGNVAAWGLGLWLMRRKLRHLGVANKDFNGGHTLSTLIRLGIAGVLAGIAGWFFLELLGDITWTSRIVAVLVVVIDCLIMSLIFVAAAFVMRVDEIREAGTLIGRKFKRSRA